MTIYGPKEDQEFARRARNHISELSVIFQEARDRNIVIEVELVNGGSYLGIGSRTEIKKVTIKKVVTENL